MVLASDHGHVWHRDAGRHAGRRRRRRALAARRRPAARGRGPARGAARARPRGAHPARSPPGPRTSATRGPQRLPRRGDAPGDGRPAGRPGRRDLPRSPCPEPCEPPPAAWWDGPDARRPARPATDARRRRPSPGRPPATCSRWSRAERGGARHRAARRPRPIAGPADPAWLDRPVRVAGLPGRSGRLVRKFAPEDDGRRAASWRRSTATAAAITPGRPGPPAGVPALRIDGLIAKLQRLLNVDGYEVLRLDRAAGRASSWTSPLLQRQFDLE